MSWKPLAALGKRFVARPHFTPPSQRGFAFTALVRGFCGGRDPRGAVRREESANWRGPSGFRRLQRASRASGTAHWARRGRFAEALPHYEEALRINPELPQAQLFWGIALAATGKRDKAIVHYREALRIKPNYAEAHFYCGMPLASQEKFKRAAEQFREALRLNPNLPKAREFLRQTEALAQQNQQPADPKTP